jgi:hypothetical protein
LAEQLGVVPPREDIERALVKAFEEALEIELSIE